MANEEQEERVLGWIAMGFLAFGVLCICLLILAGLVRWVVSWQW